MPHASPRDAPSEYVRLEAHAVTALLDEADLTPPTPLGPGEPLVVIAEADPELRAWVTRGLAETSTADAPAFRVEAVATAERLAECLLRETVAVVLCGHLAPLADPAALAASLRAEPAGGYVLVEHTGEGLHSALQARSQTLRLAEAVARLLERTPGRVEDDRLPPPPF